MTNLETKSSALQISIENNFVVITHNYLPSVICLFWLLYGIDSAYSWTQYFIEEKVLHPNFYFAYSQYSIGL